MDKQRSIAAAAETEEDRLLLARIYDKLTHAADREIFGCTGFLSPREQAMPHLPLVFFGGCEGAERCMACYVPEYLPEDCLSAPDGPAAAVRASYYEKDALTHRDFLGSLMGMGVRRDTVGDILVGAGSCDILTLPTVVGAGVKRETVGDIYVSAGQCDFLVTRQVLPYLLENLTSAGRTKLHLSAIALEDVQRPPAERKELRDTVPSLRTVWWARRFPWPVALPPS